MSLQMPVLAFFLQNSLEGHGEVRADPREASATGQDGSRGWRGQAGFGKRMTGDSFLASSSDLLPFLNLFPAPSSFSLSCLPPYSSLLTRPPASGFSLPLLPALHLHPCSGLPIPWSQVPCCPPLGPPLCGVPPLMASLLPVFQVAQTSGHVCEWWPSGHAAHQAGVPA